MSARAEKRNSAKTNERARGRVLLITDDNQTAFVEAITARGINVVGVANGAAAMVSLQRSRPHLVVANPAARNLRIRELARMLAQSDDGIPLVLAGSQPATVEIRHAALLEGAFDYFELPLEFDLLVERTQQLVALRQKIDQLKADA